MGGAGGAGQESHNIGPQSGDISSVCEANFVDNPSFILLALHSVLILIRWPDDAGAGNYD